MARENEINKTLDLYIYSTRTNEIAVATAMLHAPSGLERVITINGTDRNTVAISALSTLVTQCVATKEAEVTLTTNSQYLLRMFGGEFKKLRQDGKLTTLGTDELKAWTDLITKLNTSKNRLILTGLVNDEVLERAKATANYTLRQLKAATETTEAKEEIA